jgi:hypothetical protein
MTHGKGNFGLALLLGHAELKSEAPILLIRAIATWS